MWRVKYLLQFLAVSIVTLLALWLVGLKYQHRQERYGDDRSAPSQRLVLVLLVEVHWLADSTR